MTKKIVNIKNILRIVISVMVIFSMFKSCAKAAAVTNTMLQNINEKTNQVFEYYGYTYRNKFNSTYGIGYNPNINKMCIGITTEDSPYRPNTLFVFYPDNNPMGILSTNKYNTWFFGIVNLNNGGYSSISGGDIPITTKWKYIYTEFAWQSATGYSFSANEEYGAYIFTEPPNPFYFGHMFSQNYNYNNEVIQACELDYNYRIQFIENVVTESYEVTNITATLDDIQLESADLGSYWSLKCTNSTLLKYDKIYSLNVEITTTSNTYELSEQILFVPPGTLIESGVIIRYPSGDYSFNTVNATNQIIENQDQQQKELLNMSGDVSLVTLPVFVFSGDQSSNFFTFVLDSIEDVFLSEDEASLVLPIYEEEIEFNSADFDLLPSTLKVFIGGYHWFWVGLMILKDIRKIFENLKNGDFEKIASDDLNANLI